MMHSSTLQTEEWMHAVLSDMAEEETLGFFDDTLSSLVCDCLDNYACEELDDAFLESAAGGTGIPPFRLHHP